MGLRERNSVLVVDARILFYARYESVEQWAAIRRVALFALDNSKFVGGRERGTLGTLRLRCGVGGVILQDVRGKVLVGVAISAVVGLYWARPDLMVGLLIVIAVGVYGWRHPDLDDWRGH